MDLATIFKADGLTGCAGGRCSGLLAMAFTFFTKFDPFGRL